MRGDDDTATDCGATLISSAWADEPLTFSLSFLRQRRPERRYEMAHQSPMIAIPKKGTDEVDWTTPIRNLIAQSYGESPDNYAAECAALQRCRQDAVRGAGSDMTGASSSSIPSASKLNDPLSQGPAVQVLWTARAPGAALLRDSSQLSLARRIYEQADYADIDSVREGVHPVPNRRNAFVHRSVSE